MAQIDADTPVPVKRETHKNREGDVSKDWRLENLETQPYLRGVRFVRKMYRAYRPNWEHDHCSGCWVTLAEPSLIKGDDILHEGYATTAEFIRGTEYNWVCISCFEMFKEAMGWIDVTK